MRTTYLYPLYCTSCFKKLGTTPHNFNDKVLFCRRECYEKYSKNNNKYWNDKNE